MIQKMIIYLLLLVILPDLYIYRMFIMKRTKKRLIRLSYFIPSILLLVGLILIITASDKRFITDNAMYIGWFSIAFMTVTFPKLVFSIISLFDFLLRFLLKKRVAIFSYIGMGTAIICAGTVLYGFFIGKTDFRVNEVTISSDKIPPSFNGYRIVQISDLHVGSWKGNQHKIREAVQLINGLNPDLIVFTGDLVNSKADELDEFETELSKLKCKDGVYSVLGNHDYGTYYRWDSKAEEIANLENLKNRQKHMGWILLNNEHTLLYRQTDSIALIGVENKGEPPFSQHGDLKKALNGVKTEYKILLSHNPSHWRREVLSTNVDLMLAGHTHAMQMALGRYSLASLAYPEWGGVYKSGAQLLYVNTGLGFIGIPFRIGAWPEITLITLHSTQ